MPPAVLTPSQSTAPWQPGLQPPQTSGKAVASLVLGIANGLFMLFLLPLAILLSVLFLLFLFPLAIPAIVFGHLSRSEIAKSSGRIKGGGMALTGLIFGYGSVALVPLLGVTMAVIPSLDGFGSRQRANESSAVGGIRTINTAAVSYQAEHPEKGYPTSLDAMGGNNGTESALIDPQLASGEKAGYRFTYTPIDANGDGMVEGYLLNADPLTPGTTGHRHFFSDETGVIRYDTAQMATKESPPLE